MLDRDWWFILRNEPKSKHVFEKNGVSMQIEEDNEGDGKKE